LCYSSCKICVGFLEQIIIIGLQQRDRVDCALLFETISTHFTFKHVEIPAAFSYPLFGIFHLTKRAAPIKLPMHARLAFEAAASDDKKIEL
jgi:hypothetical protein